MYIRKRAGRSRFSRVYPGSINCICWALFLFVLSDYPEHHLGGLVIRYIPRVLILSCVLSALLAYGQSSADNHSVMLPTTKVLTTPVPGRLGSTNSFPVTMVLSPNGHYAAVLNDGYGTQETLARQSIGVLNLDTNRITDFPDRRLGDDAHQSYYIGLAF